MTKQQAAMKDAQAAKWREKKLWYRIGSVFKSCAGCGSQDVMRSYSPTDVGWTYRCIFCGAVDDVAWENAWDLGKDAIVGVRSSVNAKKRAIRDGMNPRPERSRRPASRRSQLDEIGDELARIKAMLAKMS